MLYIEFYFLVYSQYFNNEKQNILKFQTIWSIYIPLQNQFITLGQEHHKLYSNLIDNLVTLNEIQSQLPEYSALILIWIWVFVLPDRAIHHFFCYITGICHHCYFYLSLCAFLNKRERENILFHLPWFMQCKVACLLTILSSLYNIYTFL